MKNLLKSFVLFIIGMAYKLIYSAIFYSPMIELYQPVYGSKVRKGLTRECVDRWEAIRPHLPKNKGAVLDIGCNIGYFSFKCSELGHFAYGVDYHRYNILFCSAIKHQTRSNNSVFLRHLIDLEFLEKMPKFDTIINLSVFHHWVKKFGVGDAEKMMVLLATKCDCLVFETGQSDEVGSQWPETLSFMGSEPEVWIKSFLIRIGFSDVTKVGKFPTGLTKTQRTLFVAKK